MSPNSTSRSEIPGQQPLPIDEFLINFDVVDPRDYASQVWFRMENVIQEADDLADAVETSKSDKLTGVLLRDSFEEMFGKHLREQEAIERRFQQPIEVPAIRKGDMERRGLALLYIDLDGFKAVNDTFGHKAGDQVLVDAALRLEDIVRDKDVVGRLGGDEFVVLLNEGIDNEAAEEVAIRIANGIAEIPVAEEHGWIGASVGVSMYRAGMSMDDMLEDADAKMYEQKNKNKKLAATG